MLDLITFNEITKIYGLARATIKSRIAIIPEIKICNKKIENRGGMPSIAIDREYLDILLSCRIKRKNANPNKIKRKYNKKCNKTNNNLSPATGSDTSENRKVGLYMRITPLWELNTFQKAI